MTPLRQRMIEDMRLVGLRRYGQAYLDAHGTAVPRRHRRAIRALVACRTT